MWSWERMLSFESRYSHWWRSSLLFSSLFCSFVICTFNNDSQRFIHTCVMIFLTPQFWLFICRSEQYFAQVATGHTQTSTTQKNKRKTPSDFGAIVKEENKLFSFLVNFSLHCLQLLPNSFQFLSFWFLFLRTFQWLRKSLNPISKQNTQSPTVQRYVCSGEFISSNWSCFNIWGFVQASFKCRICFLQSNDLQE